MRAENDLPKPFLAYRIAVQTELERTIATCPAGLRGMLRYHMGWQDEQGHSCNRESGKFIRSGLCLLSCEAVGGNPSQAMPAAAAVELIHNFSLIHDDIQDASDERHHRPTVWKVWGQPQAINAGDAMFTLAYLALLRLKEKGIDSRKVSNCARMLTLACLELCEGQYLDIEYEGRLDVAVSDYLDMAAKKTAALLAAAAYLGGYLGSGDNNLADLFHSFGKELGIAFQICDDILGIWGTPQITGKSASDIAKKKKTLPVVYALQSADGEAKRKLEKLYSQDCMRDEHAEQVVGILDQLRAREYAQNLAEQCYRRALAQLRATGIDEQRQASLREAARFLVERKF